MGLRSLFKKKETPPTCSAVILAAGSSERMGTDKIMMKLGAMPVLARTILAFENNDMVDEIIIVTRTGCRRSPICATATGCTRSNR